MSLKPRSMTGASPLDAVGGTGRNGQPVFGRRNSCSVHRGTHECRPRHPPHAWTSSGVSNVPAPTMPLRPCHFGNDLKRGIVRNQRHLTRAKPPATNAIRGQGTGVQPRHAPPIPHDGRTLQMAFRQRRWRLAGHRCHPLVRSNCLLARYRPCQTVLRKVAKTARGAPPLFFFFLGPPPLQIIARQISRGGPDAPSRGGQLPSLPVAGLDTHDSPSCKRANRSAVHRFGQTWMRSAPCPTRRDIRVGGPQRHLQPAPHCRFASTGGQAVAVSGIAVGLCP